MTKEQILLLLATSDAAVERGICRIFANQTEDERSSGATKHSNGRGFNGHHASYGSYLAKWVLSGKHLSGRHLEAARKMCRFYIRQLVEESNFRLNASIVQHSDTSLINLDPFQGCQDMAIVDGRIDYDDYNYYANP